MKRSKFSLSNYKLFTGDPGELIPCCLTEVLPGDTIQQATTGLIRLSPLLAPMMHPYEARVYHFFVPHRLVWEDWEDFITGGPDGLNASTFPTIKSPASTGYAVGSLHDYYGVPTGVADLYHSALPARGYALIWNEWFRDQDLQNELVIGETSGVDTTTNVTLQNMAWEKDYFTSARPWAQKGAAVTIPLGTTAPVISNNANPTFTGAGLTNQNLQSVSGDNKTYFTGGNASASGAVKFGNASGLVTDLSTATAATINDLREAFALQRYEEARARYGSRYTEYLRYLGVRSSDARLQRPEYLGGGKQLLQISEVLQTGVTTSGNDTLGVGNLKGHGIGAIRSNRYRRFFEEHGYVHTFMCIKPKTMYMNGLPRTWNRRIKEDFWQLELQHIGQQEILRKEIYAAASSPDAVFGYQDRYDEYRRSESTIGGEFRTTLDFWHAARKFASEPTLNAAFVKSDPTKRNFAVSNADVLWVMTNHSIQARRMVSREGTSFIF